MILTKDSKVPIGSTSIVGWLIALSGLAPIFAKAVQEGSGIHVNGPERWFALITLGVGAITQAGRYLQTLVGISTTIKAKITTFVGWGVGVLGLTPILEKSYTEGAAALHSPEKYAAIAAAVSLGITQIARYLQSSEALKVLLRLPNVQTHPQLREA